jgi:hypothetical protein
MSLAGAKTVIFPLIAGIFNELFLHASFLTIISAKTRKG